VGADWEARVAGAGCPFDAPLPDCDDERYRIRKLQASTLYLDRNQAYRGHCLLIFDPRHATRLDELSAVEWQAYASDLQLACTAIVAVLRPDHLNVESLGNLVPHLHWHIFPRFQADPRWGKAVWTTDPADMPVAIMAPSACAELAARINAALDIAGP
jgi:diadenosine tetraphosphate (Ap4A) HIT family hydrolase